MSAARRSPRTGAPRLLLAAALVLALAPGCEAPATAPPTAVLTLGGLRAAYLAGPEAAFGVGLSSVFTTGFTPSYFLAGPDRIRLAPAYTGGRQTAYMTTDVWVNFPVVWLQPLYVFVSGWDLRPPAQSVLDLPWVAGVGDRSAFWSPFWRVYYVQVPADTPRDRYRSVRDVTEARLPIFPGPARLLTLSPPGVTPEDPATLLLPELREPGRVGSPRARTVWVDGETDERSALDFGEHRFSWNERYEISEEPLFFFFTRTAAGAWVPLTNLPRVAGTGPLFANRPAVAPDNVPRFGSLWRLYAARLPASARVLVPPAHLADWEARNAGSPEWAASLPVAELPAAMAPDVNLDAHAFKVLLDGSCLLRPTLTQADLAACPFLDSQEALERHLPSQLFPSEILVACPYLSFGGQAVPVR